MVITEDPAGDGNFWAFKFAPFFHDDDEKVVFEDTSYDNPVMEYVQLKDMTIPIHEDGSQGCSMPRVENYTSAQPGL